MDSAPALTAAATTKAKPTSTFRGATFTFYRLTRTDTSTVLLWTVTGGSGGATSDATDNFWEKYPRLRTKDSEYWVTTWRQDPTTWVSVSNPVLSLKDGVESPPQSALYPPLPPGTTSVTVRSAWFADVTVPVTTS